MRYARWSSHSDAWSSSQPIPREAIQVKIDERCIEVQTLVTARGGRWRGGRPTTRESPLELTCRRGHEFRGSLLLLRRDHWCLRCAVLDRGYRGRGSIEAMHQLAQSRGGTCLSSEYHGSTVHLQWQCSNGHVWSAKPTTISQGKWCPACAVRRGPSDKHSISSLKAIALARGGDCLSDSYAGVTARLLWRCAFGHEWQAAPKSVLAGKWCRDCAGTMPLSGGRLRAIADSRGGHLLGTAPFRSTRHTRWKCKHGHEWSATPNSVISRQSWCPECSTGISERICRITLKALFGREFPKSRPTWLRSAEGNQMELDGLCEQFAIAFEHQGEQHFSKETMYVESDAELARQMQLDDWKLALCEQHGVRLLVIPQLGSRLQREDLVPFIIAWCAGLKISIPNQVDGACIDLREAYETNGYVERVMQLREIAEEMGGKLLSSQYMGSRVKLSWRCGSGHEWSALPQSVLTGYWCPKCAALARRRPDRWHEHAASKGGVFLGYETSSTQRRVRFRCGFGHEWSTSASNANRASWCGRCAGRGRGHALSLEEMRAIAHTRGGECLSGTYRNNQTKLHWRCTHGHEWWAIPAAVKRGQWCRRCALLGRKQR